MAFKDNAVELEERVVAVNRVTKVVKGGRRLRFAALVVVGDHNGRVGFGTGKAQEVPEAIRKAVDDAKKNLIEVPMVGTTIPHEVLSEFGGAKVLLKPAVEGSGVAAGGAVRAVVELAGVADITSKSLGSNTPINIVRATVEGLKQLKRAEEVAALRGISVSDWHKKGDKMAQIKITLTKSPIGRIPSQRKTVVALGLGKLNSSVIKEDNAAIRGMITAVSHLVTVEEVN